jgi:hypothetical protein
VRRDDGGAGARLRGSNLSRRREIESGESHADHSRERDCRESQIDWVLRATLTSMLLAYSVGVSLAMTESRRRSSAPSRLMSRTLVWPSDAFRRIYADGFVHASTCDVLGQYALDLTSWQVDRHNVGLIEGVGQGV